MSHDDIVRAVTLRQVADLIVDRYMPIDQDQPEVTDTLRGILKMLNDEADRVDPARTDEWDVPKEHVLFVNFQWLEALARYQSLVASTVDGLAIRVTIEREDHEVDEGEAPDEEEEE